MNRRTKWLILGAAVVFGLYFADGLYRSQIEQPTAQLNAELDRLTKELSDSRDAQHQAKKSSQRLVSYHQRALPYDPQLARSAYQDWLLKLVEKHSVKSSAVDASQPKEIDIRSRVNRKKRIAVGHSLMYTLRGQASLAQWTDLLYEFSQAGHLHKIRSLTLNPLGSEGQLDASVTIEVLSLAGATRKDQLSDWPVLATDQPTRQDYDNFVRRNLFARGFAKALYDVQLKAITYDRQGQAEAWFQVAGSGQTQVVKGQQKLGVALHDISVEEILPDRVLIHVNRDPYWISLGQSIGEVCNIKEAS
ncbi:MAG TPA: hypothetical protein DCF63_16125 [Planctomycetaceae bacterium]|nr:hypothetical protein [Planctomycetaceae bacterium]